MSADRPPAEFAVVLTCEHAGNRVPTAWRSCFANADAQATLRTHRGWDPGALPVAQTMASRLGVELLTTPFTRLLIEPNRSPDAPDLFSTYTRDLDPAQKRTLIDTYYLPHRRAVESAITTPVVAGQRVIHVAVHSCVDELDGRRRDLDVAFLFDPERKLEHRLCTQWQAAMAASRPALRCPFNEPYLGTDDGLTTALRREFADGDYAGIELELRQGLVSTPDVQEEIAELLAATLNEAIARATL